MKHVDFIGNSWGSSSRSLHINRQVAITSQDFGFKRRVCALSAICFTEIIIQTRSLFLFLLHSNTHHDKETEENSNHDPGVTEH